MVGRVKKMIVVLVIGLLIIGITIIVYIEQQGLTPQQIVEFPIVTHYPALGGTEPDPTRVTPQYNWYSTMLTDYCAPTMEEVDNVIALIENETGLKVNMFNDIDDLIEGSPNLQIVNNVPIGTSLFTFFFSPGWSPQGSYPVVLNGNGTGISNNYALFKGRYYSPAIWAADYAENGRSGIIAAISNCGGLESQGANEEALKDVERVLEFLAGYGGDPQRVVTCGGSRGGGSALLWAENPLNLDYNVLGVFAQVPPVKFGSMSQVPVADYPALMDIYVLELNDQDAWRYDHDPPPQANPAPALIPLVGTDNVEEADQRSAFGYVHKLAGKQIVIAQGTHDDTMPMPFFLEFDRALTANGISHTTMINLRMGHESNPFLDDEMRKFLDALTSGENYTVPNGRFVFIQTDLENRSWAGIQQVPISTLPFTATIPYRIAPGQPVSLVVCGAAGKSWKVELKGPSGEMVEEWSGTFDESESRMENFIAPSVLGEYSWSFFYDGKTINNTNTPFAGEEGEPIEAITIVVANQPNSSESRYAYGRNMGVDEF